MNFAQRLWKAIEGYEGWLMQSGVYPGKSPHGAFLRTSYSMVKVDGTNFHCIVKENFGGEGATAEAVSADPAAYLAAVTVMLQREPGYDKRNADWFYAKYGADGTLSTTDENRALAGKVTGCIGCHTNAAGGDFLFSND